MSEHTVSCCCTRHSSHWTPAGVDQVVGLASSFALLRLCVALSVRSSSCFNCVVSKRMRAEKEMISSNFRLSRHKQPSVCPNLSTFAPNLTTRSWNLEFGIVEEPGKISLVWSLEVNQIPFSGLCLNSLSYSTLAPTRFLCATPLIFLI